MEAAEVAEAVETAEAAEAVGLVWLPAHMAHAGGAPCAGRVQAVCGPGTHSVHAVRTQGIRIRRAYAS